MPRDKPFWEEHFAGVVGLAILVVSVLLAIWFPEPTLFQKRVFIAGLSIGVGGIASEVPGMLNVKVELGTQLSIAATGAVATFVLIYFFGPG